MCSTFFFEVSFSRVNSFFLSVWNGLAFFPGISASTTSVLFPPLECWYLLLFSRGGGAGGGLVGLLAQIFQSFAQ